MERNVQEGTDGVKAKLNEIIFQEILRQGLGIIPDEKEHWLTPYSIAYVIGKNPHTVQNWISTLRKHGTLPPEHELGGYYRLTEMISALKEYRGSLNGDSRLKSRNGKKTPKKKSKR